ncbi:M56 family metallopeptidase [Anaerotignum sp.]|uniref:M56 family metallopeptidase n=1 Tax=Anaerotignum sp. TaxID=2039241 RepID=UPI002714E451|nr:M56 family metallopeptidase [Anaerotignum sp.]
MDIFQMSLSGTVLIVAVIIIRALALYRLPKKTFLVLWGVVICRLCIPFSIPSHLSFFTGINLLKQTFSEMMIPDAAMMTNNVLLGTMHTVENGATRVSISPIMLIWLTGVCACSLFFIVTYIKCCKEFQASLPVENRAVYQWLWEQPMRRKVQIMQSDRIKAPLTYGIFHPVVLLPKTMDYMDETKLKYIFMHEFVHIRRFDNLTKLLLALVLCVYWFNPLVWVMYALANRDIELSCDETVLQKFGETMKSAYAMMLISMEEKKSRLSPMCSNFSKNVIEERIMCIMKIKKVTMLSITMATILVAGTATVFATSASAADTAKETATQYIASTTESDLQNGLTLTINQISYNDYQDWLKKYKIMIQEEVQNGSLSQQTADKTIQEHEQILTNIQNGDQVSLKVDPNKEEVLIVPQTDFKVTEIEDGVITIE